MKGIKGKFDLDLSKKYGMIFKCLRMVQDINVNAIARDLSCTPVYLHQIENGTLSPTIISFAILCKFYGVKSSEFMAIAEKAYEENFSFQEILLECSKYESAKHTKNTDITEEEKKQKLGLILKGMRNAQIKSRKDVALEIGMKDAIIAAVEGLRQIPTLKTFKKYIRFFQMLDEDFEKLYELAISQNLSYLEILSYCLTYDIERQKKQNLNPDNQ